MQTLMDKLAQKEKIAQANKTILRHHETKFKNIEMQVNQLLKLKKQVEDQYKQLKRNLSDVEMLQQYREVDTSKEEFAAV